MCCSTSALQSFYTSVAASSHLTHPLHSHRPHCLCARRLSPPPPPTHPTSPPSQLWPPNSWYLPPSFAVTIPHFLTGSPPPVLHPIHSYHVSAVVVSRHSFVSYVHPLSPPLSSLPLPSPAWALSPHDSLHIAVVLSHISARPPLCVPLFRLTWRPHAVATSSFPSDVVLPIKALRSQKTVPPVSALDYHTQCVFSMNAEKRGMEERVSVSSRAAAAAAARHGCANLCG